MLHFFLEEQKQQRLALNAIRFLKKGKLLSCRR